MVEILVLTMLHRALAANVFSADSVVFNDFDTDFIHRYPHCVDLWLG